MKITVSQLRRIIKEEVQKVALREGTDVSAQIVKRVLANAGFVKAFKTGNAYGAAVEAWSYLRGLPGVMYPPKETDPIVDRMADWISQGATEANMTSAVLEYIDSFSSAPREWVVALSGHILPPSYSGLSAKEWDKTKKTFDAIAAKNGIKFKLVGASSANPGYNSSRAFASEEEAQAIVDQLEAAGIEAETLAVDKGYRV